MSRDRAVVSRTQGLLYDSAMLWECAVCFGSAVCVGSPVSVKTWWSVAQLLRVCALGSIKRKEYSR